MCDKIRPSMHEPFRIHIGRFHKLKSTKNDDVTNILLPLNSSKCTKHFHS